MANKVAALCPKCQRDIDVDPVGETWPEHLTLGQTGGSHVCPASGTSLPFVADPTKSLRVKGVPVVRIPAKNLESGRVYDLVGVAYIENEVHVYFPPLDGVECCFQRSNPTGQPAELIVRLGDGFLAPKVTMLVEYPKMPKFSSPEEADEWMERMSQ